MNANVRRRGVSEYANMNAHAGTVNATPHRLIQMLMEGFLARVNAAKGAMENHNYPAKGDYISKAIAILGGLEEGLDLEKGGELAQNLSGLYRYMRTQLIMASGKNSTEILDEVCGLMREIKSAWDAIPPDLHGAPTD